eukprot:c903_g1_i1 orf=157-432(+)
MEDIRDDVEVALMGPYHEKTKTFPALRKKSQTHWLFRVLCGLNKRVYYLSFILFFGMLLYVGKRTSPIIVFVFAVCTASLLFAAYLTNWVL